MSGAGRTESLAEDEQWWVDGPIFSTRRQGARITAVGPGRVPGRFTPGMLFRIALTAVFWAGLGFLVLPKFLSQGLVPWVEHMSSQWWVYALLALWVLGFFTVGSAFGLSRAATRSYGQQGVASVLAALPIVLGLLAALGVHLWVYAEFYSQPHRGLEPWELPDPVLFVIAATVAAAGVLVLVVWLPISIVRARHEQRDIARLRDEGARFSGVVVNVRFRHEQIGSFVQFDTTIVFTTLTGDRSVEARMSTSSDRVPLSGFAVRAFVGDTRGGRARREMILIEPDLSQQACFDPDSSKYSVRT